MAFFDKKFQLNFLIIALGFIPIIFGISLSLDKIIRTQRDQISVNAIQLMGAEKLRSLAEIPGTTLDQRRVQFRETLEKMLASERDPVARKILTKVALAPAAERVRLLQDLTTAEAREMDEAKARFSRTVDWIIGSLLFLLCLTLSLVIFITRLVFKILAQQRAADEAQVALLRREQQLSAARREVVEVVAHDLKNPLGTIKMGVEMMLDDLASGVRHLELKEGFEIIHRSAESMECLIRDLLDHAKIEAGHLILNKKTVDVRDLSRDLVQRFEPLARRKSVALRTQHAEQPCPAECDVVRIEQVLSNVLGNARKSTPAVGAVTLNVGCEKNEVTIAIEDTGMGMEPNELEHIFDRFWQVKSAATQGNGLGLAIAKGIIDAHKGRIWAESTKGQGSRFFVRLPAAAPQPETPVQRVTGLNGLATASV